ncbi:MAG: KpsF/GutQ family sugar-phosphate isomerase [Phycisphaerae bacterium]
MGDPILLARSVIEEEGRALSALAAALDDSFRRAVERILAIERRGRVVVAGVGKSGLVGRKIAATLSSTGTAAVYLHPVEALHGDLGVVGSDDVLLALSKSGHTEEVVRLAGHFKRLGGHVIAACEARDAPLAELAEIVLLMPKRNEAGPLSLAPTTSTTMLLALGDALAMALLDARGFAAEDFARFHPNGALGRRLLLRAADLMHAGPDLPRVAVSSPFRDLLHEMTSKHLGMACLVDGQGALVGVFTDGDLRRVLERVDRPLDLVAGDAWRRSRRDPNDTPVPVSTISEQLLAVDCLDLMRREQITALVVAGPRGEPIGVVRLQDVVRAGITAP